MENQNHKSQVTIIVGMSKVTSAFEDIMEIEGEKIYKGSVKKYISEFQTWYDEFTSRIAGLFYEDPQNAKFFEQTISTFDKYSEYYDVGSEKCTRMALAFGKLSSSKDDFNSIPVGDTDNHVVAQLIAHNIQKLVNQGFWKQFCEMEDKSGANINSLIQSLNETGQSIYE